MSTQKMTKTLPVEGSIVIRKPQAGDSTLTIEGKPGMAVIIRDLSQAGGPELGQATLNSKRTNVPLSQRLSGGHVIAIMTTDDVVTTVVSGIGDYMPPPPPRSPPPPPPPPPPVRVLLRDDKLSEGEGWLVPTVSEVLPVLYDPQRTGVLAFGVDGQKTPGWKDLVAAAKQCVPDLADIADLVRVFISPEFLFIRGIHHLGASYGGDERQALDNLRGLVRRLRALGAVSEDLAIVGTLNGERLKSRVSEWQ